MCSAEYTVGRYVVTLASFEALSVCKSELVVLLVPPLPWKAFLQASLVRAGVISLQCCKKGGTVCIWPH